MLHSPVVRLAASLGLVASLFGCGGGSDGASSPEALAEKINEASKSEDMATLVECIAPDDRSLMSMGIVMAGQMATTMGGMIPGAKPEGDGKDAKGDFDAILKKHGVGELKMDLGMMMDEAKMREQANAAMKDVDHAALVAEVTTFLKGMGDNKGGKGSSNFNLAGELADLKIDGDSATGKMGTDPVEFVKIDGNWYVRLPEKKG